nr:PREDICTED: uncharacterized protein LOC100881519 isoform X2 [Megachile rotundata]
MIYINSNKMSEVIILSDSNESDLSIELNDELKNINEKKKPKPLFNDSDSNDFEFPEVQFFHTVNSTSCDNNSMNYSHNFDSCIPLCQTNNKFSTDNNACHVPNSMDFSEESSKGKNNYEKTKKNKTLTKKSKDHIMDQGLKKQELLKEKALRAVALKRSKNLKPGECLKFIEVVLDTSIENYPFITDIVNTLLDANVRYSINTGLISNSILWKRIVENHYVNESNEICTATDIETINQIVVIWNWDEVVTKVIDGSFCDSIVNIKTSLSNYKIILVIFGIDDYFTHKKQVKHSGKKKTKRTNACNTDEFKNFQEISRQELEMCLNEIQIVAKCNSRLINTSQDLALMVYQCTKAIAEIPYKLEKNRNLNNKFDWYVMGDNRNTVRVDKDGNGLRRLWQQQLCQFNLSSLEIAEAICSVYSSPSDLVETYMNCTNDEGLNLLKDIPIRRAAGPLTAVRKRKN